SRSWMRRNSIRRRLRSAGSPPVTMTTSPTIRPSSPSRMTSSDLRSTVTEGKWDRCRCGRAFAVGNIITTFAGGVTVSAVCGSRFTCHDGHMAERDRDESGRPRSTRPRDALGRPLRQGSEGVARIPDDLALPPAETLAYAQDLLDRGLAFNAHEVLEAAWKNGPDD